MPNKKWTTAELPSLAGKTALVTGANRGLGLEITAGLAGAGATVVMACRDAGKAQAAAAEVRRRVPAAKLELMSLDLANLDSIRAFAKDFTARHSKLDLLVNNASAIMVPKGKTRDGFETHIGTNHFGTYALTGLLLDALKAAPGARVVGTSSMAHKMTKGLDLDDYNFEHTKYKEMDAYGGRTQARHPAVRVRTGPEAEEIRRGGEGGGGASRLVQHQPGSGRRGAALPQRPDGPVRFDGRPARAVRRRCAARGRWRVLRPRRLPATRRLSRPSRWIAVLKPRTRHWRRGCGSCRRS